MKRYLIIYFGRTTTSLAANHKSYTWRGQIMKEIEDLCRKHGFESLEETDKRRFEFGRPESVVWDNLFPELSYSLLLKFGTFLPKHRNAVERRRQEHPVIYFIDEAENCAGHAPATENSESIHVKENKNMTADMIATKTVESVSEEKIAKTVDAVVAKCLEAAQKGEWKTKLALKVSPAEKLKVIVKIKALGYEIQEEEDGEYTLSWENVQPALPQIRFSNVNGCVAFEDCDGERQVLFPPFNVTNLCVEHGLSRNEGPGPVRRLALYANGEVYELARSSTLSISQMNLLSEMAQAGLLTAMAPVKGK
jgi:hypothetical protein